MLVPIGRGWSPVAGWIRLAVPTAPPPRSGDRDGLLRTNATGKVTRAVRPEPVVVAEAVVVVVAAPTAVVAVSAAPVVPTTVVVAAEVAVVVMAEVTAVVMPRGNRCGHRGCVRFRKNAEEHCTGDCACANCACC